MLFSTTCDTHSKNRILNGYFCVSEMTIFSILTGTNYKIIKLIVFACTSKIITEIA